ncbi:hypothetical protein [Kineothrix alysoides]|nr:hypothetical protein [Kineothrix alysoides]
MKHSAAIPQNSQEESWEGQDIMYNYTKKELTEALQAVSSFIGRCEKMQGKFKEGTSQHTLLRNRIKAMYISEALLKDGLTQNEESEGKHLIDNYTEEDLKKALPPVASIISKCEKAQGKFAEGTSQYIRYKNMIEPMYLAKELIEIKLSQSSTVS